jgi:hypothetical protein
MMHFEYIKRVSGEYQCEDEPLFSCKKQSTLALEFSTFQPPPERFSEQNPRLRLHWNSQ